MALTRSDQARRAEAKQHQASTQTLQRQLQLLQPSSSPRGDGNSSGVGGARALALNRATSDGSLFKTASLTLEADAAATAAAAERLRWQEGGAGGGNDSNNPSSLLLLSKTEADAEAVATLQTENQRFSTALVSNTQ